MATSKKSKTQIEVDREIILSYLRSMPEEIFHVNKELAFTRDEKCQRLLVTHLDKCIVVEVEVPFTAEFSVERVKVDKDRKGFTMFGWQGEVWYDLEMCWKKAKPLEKPIQSPFPEVIIDQKRPFSIYQEPDEFSIEVPLAQVGEIKLKPGENGIFYIGRIHKFRCYPVSENIIIDHVTPVAPTNYPDPFPEKEDQSSSQEFTGEEILMNEFANDVFAEVFPGDDFLDEKFERLHFKWTVNGMCFECETENIDFGFAEQVSIWGVETDEFLYTILAELDTFEWDEIRNMVDYFRTYEGDEVMRIIHGELAGFLKNPDWNSFLKWSYDGTFRTGELRRILENILTYSKDYLIELELDQPR